MELLKDGWTPLFNYRENMRRSGIPEGSRSRLLKRLEGILDYLGAVGMVHGDFRTANIMLKPEEEEKAVLIDFDWAGKAGIVRYPITRNDSFGYPGEPGGPIGAEDDRQFYETWKNEI
jgi:serine/threonine protein kinase